MEENKKYIIPELIVISFDDRDIITDSEEDWGVGGGSDTTIA